MKILNEKPVANGRRRITLELDPGERLLPVRDNAHYQLGEPVGDIVAAHVLADSRPVDWCSIEQRWA